MNTQRCVRFQGDNWRLVAQYGVGQHLGRLADDGFDIDIRVRKGL